MPLFPSRCPACAGPLHASRLSCSGCETHLEGRFELPPLLRLDRDDLAFITAFVRHSGSLKQMGTELGLSYPSVRNRLDTIIGRLETQQAAPEAERRKILFALSARKISVKEAALRLQALET